MTISEARSKYNVILSRYNAANDYFSNDIVSQKEKEKFLPNFQEILKDLNYLLSKVGDYSDKEVLGGFDIG